MCRRCCCRRRRVLLLCVGSRGDVEPYCALLQRLLSRNNANDCSCSCHCGDECRNFDHGIDTNSCYSCCGCVEYEYEVEMFIQTNLTYMVDAYRNHPLFTLHEFPFANHDFHDVPRIHDSKPNNPDPLRMKNVSRLADIIETLVLPCTKQVYQIAATKPSFNSSSNRHSKCHCIITSAMTRSLAFLVGIKLDIPVILLHLQPLLPNTIFPSYRTSREEFVKVCGGSFSSEYGSIAGGSDLNKKIGASNYPETYWKIDYVLEECFLKDRVLEEWKGLEALDSEGKEECDEHRQSSPKTESSLYTNPPEQYWPTMQRILSGHFRNIWIVNAYSNELVPKIVADFSDSDEDDSNHDGSNDRRPALCPTIGPNVSDVGPLADAYLPPDFDPSKLAILESFLESVVTCSHEADGESGHSIITKPICIGFGSMPFRNISVVLDAVNYIEVPAILVGRQLYVPQSHPMAIAKQIFWIESIPYAYLLPKCSMMICHGGIGVVQACLHAGTPCLVSPLMGDQFALSQLVESKGLGVRVGSDKLSELTTQDIVVAVRRVAIESGITQNCHDLGEKIQRRLDAVNNGASSGAFRRRLTGIGKFVKLLETQVISK